jgi:hypothetical protein
VLRHPDLNALLNDLLSFAERMLAEHGEFYPFGGSIVAAGKHVSVGAKRSSDRPKSQELIDIMTNAFRSQASKEGFVLRAFASTFASFRRGRSTRQTRFSSPWSARTGDAVDVFVSYAQVPDGEFSYGEVFASERTPTMFLVQQDKDLTKH